MEINKKPTCSLFLTILKWVYQHREANPYPLGKGTMMKRKKMWLLILLGNLIVFGGCTGEGEEWYFPTTTTEITEDRNLSIETGEITKKILVYVCGAVKEPGVVELESDARVVDAITLVGGFEKEADETYINLAGKLQDGEKIYVPTVSEVSQWNEEKGSEKLIDINTADIEELCKLSGIGESKAMDIITYREKKGPFQRKEDLMKVPGIKQNLYEKIEDNIIVK